MSAPAPRWSETLRHRIAGAVVRAAQGVAIAVSSIRITTLGGIDTFLAFRADGKSLRASERIGGGILLGSHFPQRICNPLVLLPNLLPSIGLPAQAGFDDFSVPHGIFIDLDV
jgi:hypothetical protein